MRFDLTYQLHELLTRLRTAAASADDDHVRAAALEMRDAASAVGLSYDPAAPVDKLRELLGACSRELLAKSHFFVQVDVAADASAALLASASSRLAIHASQVAQGDVKLTSLLALLADLWDSSHGDNAGRDSLAESSAGALLRQVVAACREAAAALKTSKDGEQLATTLAEASRALRFAAAACPASEVRVEFMATVEPPRPGDTRPDVLIGKRADLPVSRLHSALATQGADDFYWLSRERVREVVEEWTPKLQPGEWISVHQRTTVRRTETLNLWEI